MFVKVLPGCFTVKVKCLRRNKNASVTSLLGQEATRETVDDCVCASLSVVAVVYILSLSG